MNNRLHPLSVSFGYFAPLSGVAAPAGAACQEDGDVQPRVDPGNLPLDLSPAPASVSSTGWSTTRTRQCVSLKKKMRASARLRKKPLQITPEATPEKNPGPNIRGCSHEGEDLAGSINNSEKQTSEWTMECTGLVTCPCSDHDDCGCIFLHCGCPPSPPDPCRSRGRLLGKARGVLRHLRKFDRLKSSGKIPPDELTCLNFRSVIRRQLPDQITFLEELTVKTASKIVRRPCKACKITLSKTVGRKLKVLFQNVPKASDADLRSFRRAFALNVDEGWNKTESAYIPNGHATAAHMRIEGGNWNEEEFAEQCSVGAILSSGKPRVVTMYSSYNSEILTPLHRSLYSTLRRKGWCLVGPPTDEKVQMLNGLGPYASYDYDAATDNIKAEYVREAINILKEKACPRLTEEESRCLDVVGHLRVSGSRHAAPRGQPMGSLMSFPLLCLFNKTVVDLAMVDLLENKKVTYKEFVSHRCLINGDDLLLRSPLKDHSLYDRRHRYWGAAVGFVVNREKTLVSDSAGEINSTLFVNGKKEKKTNLAALYMSCENGDVVGTAMEATRTLKEFRRVVELNVNHLARQRVKFPSTVPFKYRVFLLGSEKIRRALRACPSTEVPAASGALPMAEKPLGYDLTPGEECQTVREAVSVVRRLRIFEEKIRETKELSRLRGGTRPVNEEVFRLRDTFRPKRTKPDRELILECLARRWEWKRKEALRVEECGSLGPPSQIVSDDTRIGAMVDCLRAWKSACYPPTAPLVEEKKVSWSLGSHRESEIVRVFGCGRSSSMRMQMDTSQ